MYIYIYIYTHIHRERERPAKGLLDHFAASPGTPERAHIRHGAARLASDRPSCDVHARACPCPNEVLQASLCACLLHRSALQTVLGVGAGMNIPADWHFAGGKEGPAPLAEHVHKHVGLEALVEELGEEVQVGDLRVGRPSDVI